MLPEGQQQGIGYTNGFRCYRSSIFLTAAQPHVPPTVAQVRYGRAPRGANEFHRCRGGTHIN